MSENEQIVKLRKYVQELRKFLEKQQSYLDVMKEQSKLMSLLNRPRTRSISRAIALYQENSGHVEVRKPIYQEVSSDDSDYESAASSRRGSRVRGAKRAICESENEKQESVLKPAPKKRGRKRKQTRNNAPQPKTAPPLTTTSDYNEEDQGQLVAEKKKESFVKVPRPSTAKEAGKEDNGVLIHVKTHESTPTSNKPSDKITELVDNAANDSDVEIKSDNAEKVILIEDIDDGKSVDINGEKVPLKPTQLLVSLAKLIAEYAKKGNLNDAKALTRFIIVKEKFQEIFEKLLQNNRLAIFEENPTTARITNTATTSACLIDPTDDEILNMEKALSERSRLATLQHSNEEITFPHNPSENSALSALNLFCDTLSEAAVNLLAQHLQQNLNTKGCEIDVQSLKNLPPFTLFPRSFEKGRPTQEPDSISLSSEDKNKENLPLGHPAPMSERRQFSNIISGLPQTTSYESVRPNPLQQCITMFPQARPEDTIPQSAVVTNQQQTTKTALTDNNIFKAPHNAPFIMNAHAQNSIREEQLRQEHLQRLEALNLLNLQNKSTLNEINEKASFPPEQPLPSRISSRRSTVAGERLPMIDQPANTRNFMAPQYFHGYSRPQGADFRNGTILPQNYQLLNYPPQNFPPTSYPPPAMNFTPSNYTPANYSTQNFPPANINQIPSLHPMILPQQSNLYLQNNTPRIYDSRKTNLLNRSTANTRKPRQTKNKLNRNALVPPADRTQQVPTNPNLIMQTGLKMFTDNHQNEANANQFSILNHLPKPNYPENQLTINNLQFLNCNTTSNPTDLVLSEEHATSTMAQTDSDQPSKNSLVQPLYDKEERCLTHAESLLKRKYYKTMSGPTQAKRPYQINLVDADLTSDNSLESSNSSNANSHHSTAGPNNAAANFNVIDNVDSNKETDCTKGNKNVDYNFSVTSNSPNSSSRKSVIMQEPPNHEASAKKIRLLNEITKCNPSLPVDAINLSKEESNQSDTRAPRTTNSEKSNGKHKLPCAIIPRRKSIAEPLLSKPRTINSNNNSVTDQSDTIVKVPELEENNNSNHQIIKYVSANNIKDVQNNSKSIPSRIDNLKILNAEHENKTLNKSQNSEQVNNKAVSVIIKNYRNSTNTDHENDQNFSGSTESPKNKEFLSSKANSPQLLNAENESNPKPADYYNKTLKEMPQKNLEQLSRNTNISTLDNVQTEKSGRKLSDYLSIKLETRPQTRIENILSRAAEQREKFINTTLFQHTPTLNPEEYVKEMRSLESAAVPNEFFGFYKYLTNKQISYNQAPISFKTFLEFQNAGRLNEQHKSYLLYLKAHSAKTNQ